ncbi:hypothetical protein ACA910_022005 [Epithemia clementina (nom. ined.)]
MAMASLRVPEITTQRNSNNDTEASSSKHGGDRIREVKFISPLLDYGYRPTVEEFEAGTLNEKPLLLYLPGFDGTFLSPFLQFPELDTIFDVRCMTVSTKDRSTYDELKASVVNFLDWTLSPNVAADVDREHQQEDTPDNNLSRGRKRKRSNGGRGNWLSRLFSKNEPPRPIYLAGESFGGILALDVTLTILRTRPYISLQGLCLINAATCYDRSRLAAEAPAVAKYPWWLYTFGLLKLLPLFADEYSLDQLLLILRAEALPSLVDNETREAYMGRVALSLPFVIPFLDQAVLKWRLTEWLSYGCNLMLSQLSEFAKYPTFRTLIVAGEKDGALPSIGEAERLASLLPPPSTLHVVDGAGHASTCGARVDLAALFRLAFPELHKRDKRKTRTSMKEMAAAGEGAYFGMEPRYDNATVGLSPLRYWDLTYFKRFEPTMLTNFTKIVTTIEDF